MRILTALTYYRPHTSGLTIYAERLARALVQRGHEVTVLTSRYERSLPAEEVRDGVRVVRFPVLFRVSKGVISPTVGLMATRLALEHDALILHLPQFDAAGIALRGRLFRKPTVLTYHCDLSLPTGWFNAIVNQVVHMMNHLAALSAHRIVTYTQDYADHSPYLQRHAAKQHIIPPPVELPEIPKARVAEFARDHNPEGRRPVIGMATRFATEKGVEVLLDALPKVLDSHPDAMVLFAGQYEEVMGEEAYFERLAPRIQEHQERGRWRFLGVLSPEEMASFYPILDALVVPSLNSTEAFGLVQIEAMIRGTPSVASSLPGVRQPVRMTGMGRVVPIGDAQALANALLEILADPDRFQADPGAIAGRFAPDSIAAAYENLFAEIQAEL